MPVERNEAERLLEERAGLREAKDFAAADEIRGRLRRGGWDVVDTPEGSRLREVELPPPPRAVTMLTVLP